MASPEGALTAALLLFFNDFANPASNSIYQKLGYEPVCDYLEMDALR